MNRNATSKGFTLVELMLAMAFIAVLLISIALLVMQIGKLYDRGITLRQVNISGRTISDDIERTISASTTVDTSRIADGRLCTGEYSYVWNTAEQLKFETPEAEKNKYTSLAPSGKYPRLVKVPDATRALCAVSLPNVSYAQAVELLPPGDRSLAVHRLAVTSDVNDIVTKQQLYRVVFLLGTDELGEINTASGNCNPTAGSSLSHCAINQFSLTVRAGSGI